MFLEFWNFEILVGSAVSEMLRFACFYVLLFIRQVPEVCEASRCQISRALATSDVEEAARRGSPYVLALVRGCLPWQKTGSGSCAGAALIIEL